MQSTGSWLNQPLTGKNAVQNTDEEEDGGEMAEGSPQFRMTANTTGPQSGGPQSSLNAAAQHACATCNRSFDTARGLGVHIKKKHPAQANDAIDVERSKRRWNDEELRLMADYEADATLSNVMHMNQHLLTLLPERTLEAIKGQRRKADYRQLVQNRLAALRNEIVIENDNPLDVIDDRQEDEPSTSAEGTGRQLRDEILKVIQENIEEVRKINSPFAKELVELGNSALLNNVMDEARFMRAISNKFKNTRTPKGPMFGKTTVYQGTSKQKRKQRYAVVQSLYKKDIGAAARVVLKDNDSIATKIPQTRMMFEYWKNVFATEGGGPRNSSSMAPSCPQMQPIWRPVTIDDIKAARAANEKGAGPDGIIPKDWNRIDDRQKCLLYNLFLFYEKVPNPIKGSRTVFIPKVDGGSTDPGDFRPLTICSVILREFNKILARRIVSCYAYDERQTAYLPIDGVCINTSLLTAIIAEAKRSKKELHIAILDLIKAFNSVYHSALTEAITEIGCPPGFIAYIKDMYHNVTTAMQFEGKSEQASILAGVYQGDPLSGPLFTIAYEKALKALNNEIGFDLQDVRVNASAYSDDGLLLAMTVIGMQHNLDKFGDTLAKIGLKINPRKSKTISFVPSGRDKKMKIVTNKQFTVDGEEIDTLTISDFWKYLGVVYSASGPEVAKVNLEDELIKLTKGPLKPQQRIHLLKTFVIAKHQQRLVLSRTTAVGLNKMDLQIRKYVRRWLHLPKDMPVAYIHAPVKAGGLGIPCLKQWIPLMRFLRLMKVKRTGGDRIAAVLNCELYKSIIHSAKQALSVLECGDEPTLQGYHDFWKKELLEMVDGKDLKPAQNHTSSTSFNSTRMNDISGEDYIHYNQIRTNSCPTRKRTARGRPNKPTTCRAGCRRVETLQHVVQECVRTHGGRTLRHDRVVDMLADEFKTKGYAVEKEVYLRTSEELFKPDLVMKKNNKAYVIDAQIVQCGKLETDYRLKVCKYRDDTELNSVIKSKYDVQEVKYEACTISYKGMWSRQSVASLQELGIGSYCLFKIVTSVLRGTWLNWQRFNKTTTVVH